MNGDKCFPIGKQAEKMMGGTKMVPPSKGYVAWLISKACGINGSRTKINQNEKWKNRSGNGICTRG